LAEYEVYNTHLVITDSLFSPLPFVPPHFFPRLSSYPSGFFNGAAFFDGSQASKVATGAMFMIMGFAWAVGAPIGVLLIFLVSS